jgi:hypothetical protein
MHCRHCGARNPGNSNFCFECGVMIDQGIDRVENYEGGYTSTSPQLQKPKRRNSIIGQIYDQIWPWFLGLFLFLILPTVIILLSAIVETSFKFSTFLIVISVVLFSLGVLLGYVWKAIERSRGAFLIGGRYLGLFSTLVSVVLLLLIGSTAIAPLFENFIVVGDRQDKNAIVNEITTTINVSESVDVESGDVSVFFPEDCVEGNTELVVEISEISENSDIVSGVFVDMEDVTLTKPVYLEFSTDAGLPVGAVVPLKYAKSIKDDWQDAYSMDGNPIFGFVTKNQTIIAQVDHFSGYAIPVLSNLVITESHAQLRKLFTDTTLFESTKGIEYRVPVDFDAEALIYGSDIPELTRLFGLDDDATRRIRYKEVLVDLFLQTDVEFSIEKMNEVQEFLAPLFAETTTKDDEYIHELNIEAGVAATEHIVIYDGAMKDGLRVLRPMIYSGNNNKYVRLDYVGNRLSGYIDTFMDSVTFSGDVIAFGKDLYQASLYLSLRDAIVLDRIDRFEQLINNTSDVDPELIEAFYDARKEVKLLLDDWMYAFATEVTKNWTQYAKTATHAVFFLAKGKSLTGLLKVHPFAVFVVGFIEIYNEDVLNSYADMQRAALAAMLITKFFPPLNELEEKIKGGDPISLDIATMKLFLGQYYYATVSEELLGSPLSRLAAWIVDNKDYALSKDRENYLKATAQTFYDNYIQIEAERRLAFGGPPGFETDGEYHVTTASELLSGGEDEFVGLRVKDLHGVGIFFFLEGPETYRYMDYETPQGTLDVGLTPGHYKLTIFLCSDKLEYDITIPENGSVEVEVETGCKININQ